MPPNQLSDLSPAERRHEVASIFTHGILRWHRRAKSGEIIDFQKFPPVSEPRLELSGETPLSVGTRGFTPGSDGD